MSEFSDHLVDELVVSGRPRNRRHLCVRRHLGDKLLGIEFAQLIQPDAAGQDRDVINVGVGHHGCQRLLGVVRGKLAHHVPFPKIAKFLLFWSEIRRCHSRLSML
jgi:hypothetical protein